MTRLAENCYPRTSVRPRSCFLGFLYPSYMPETVSNRSGIGIENKKAAGPFPRLQTRQTVGIVAHGLISVKCSIPVPVRQWATPHNYQGQKKKAQNLYDNEGHQCYLTHGIFHPEKNF